MNLKDSKGSSNGGLPSSSEMQELINLDVQQIALEMQRDMQYNKQKQKSRKAQDLGGDPEDKDLFVEETLKVVQPEGIRKPITNLKISCS
jgi:hypothetical protein